MCNLVSNFVSCTDLCNIDSHVQTKTEISAIYKVVIYDMSRLSLGLSSAGPTQTEL